VKVVVNFVVGEGTAPQEKDDTEAPISFKRSLQIERANVRGEKIWAVFADALG
jgi:hypothetical protein